MNKKILFLFFIVLMSACKRDNEPAPEPVSRFILSVSKETMSSTGEITAEPIKAIIHVWKAENSNFDVNASPNLFVGEVYDKTSGTFRSIEYGAIGTKMNEMLQPGRYFVYVLLPKSTGSSDLAYSYTYIDIKEGKNLSLTKTFKYTTGAGMYDAWVKSK
ncbi:hypothetical protein ACMA1I_22945 [Pontibacter sp. 13R65]|uniref:hypothetical protein n=1 Tax=Pontibacter sp. 13R65 TaxID=3127458 RepID=UPI00301C2258